MRLPPHLRKGNLGAAERNLRELISRENGSPFIAHHDLSEEQSRDALRALVDETNGEINTFLNVMERYPCFSVWCVATAVASGYTSDTDHAVYLPIANQIGADIPPSRRKDLNSAFRSACLSLGLALPYLDLSRHNYVEDYLFQGGIPVVQLQPLADAFLRAEHGLGAPSPDDIDDTDYINSWEDSAAQLVASGLTVIRRILSKDSTGYHAAVFLRLRTGHVPESRFERLFLRAIQERTVGYGPVAATPYLTLDDGELRVEVSPRGSALDITFGTEEHRISPGGRCVVPLPWPNRLRWRVSGGAHAWQHLSICPSDRGNDVLVFDDNSGRHRATLNEARPCVRVRSGSIALASMNPFEVNGEQAHQLGDTHLLHCDLLGTREIRLGEEIYRLEVDRRLRLEMGGRRVARCGREWWLAGVEAVFIRGDVRSAGHRLEVKVEHPSVPSGIGSVVRLTTDGAGMAPLGLPDEGPFGMARVSVHVKGQTRALYRHRFWYWPGLKGLRDNKILDAPSIPENLARGELRFIHERPNGQLALDTERPYLRATIAFKDSEQGTIAFTFPPPDVSVCVRNSAGDEQPMKVGDTLEIAGDLASYLIIRSPQQVFAIDYKGQIEHLPFDRSGLWKRPFAALQEPGEHDRVRMLRSSDGAAWKDLVRILVPSCEKNSHSEDGRADSGAAHLIKQRMNDPMSAPARVPDVRMSVVGTTGRRLLEIGGILTLRANEPAGELLVECGDRLADLNLGGEIIRRPFKRGRWSLELEKVKGHGWLTIELCPSQGRPTALIRIGPPAARTRKVVLNRSTKQHSKTADEQAIRVGRQKHEHRTALDRLAGQPAAAAEQGSAVATRSAEKDPVAGGRDRRPRLVVDGRPVAKNDRGLLIANPRHLFLRDCECDAGLLEVSVEHPGIDGCFPVPVTVGASHEMVARLPLPARGPFGAARVAVHPRYHPEQPIARCRFWYWPGLRGLHRRILEAKEIPPNLVEARSEGVEISDGKVRLRPELGRGCRLAFDLGVEIVTLVVGRE